MISDYKIPQLTVDNHVADLIKRMTLEEKITQMLCIWKEKDSILFDTNGKLNLSSLKTELKDGVGQVGRLSDAADKGVKGF